MPIIIFDVSCEGLRKWMVRVGRVPPGWLLLPTRYRYDFQIERWAECLEDETRKRVFIATYDKDFQGNPRAVILDPEESYEEQATELIRRIAGKLGAGGDVLVKAPRLT